MGEVPNTTDSSTRPIIPTGTIVDGYMIIKKVGRGGYSDLYQVKSVETNEKYAMKIERYDNIKHGLSREIEIMKVMGESKLFPKFICDGSTSEFIYVVMELLGASVSILKQNCPHGKFDEYTLLQVSFEMLRCIQEIHRHGFIHRDIKPANFLVRASRKNPIVLVDFGLSNRLYDVNNKHIPYREDAGFIGTSSFCSPHAYKREEQSRRDDLYSWFYSVIDMAEGRVPWPGRADRELTQKMKLETTPEELCRSLPKEFITIYQSIEALTFKGKPPYKAIRDCILGLIKERKFPIERYQWETFPPEKIAAMSAIPLQFPTPPIVNDEGALKLEDDNKGKEIEEKEKTGDCEIA